MSAPVQSALLSLARSYKNTGRGATEYALEASGRGYGRNDVVNAGTWVFGHAASDSADCYLSERSLWGCAVKARVRK